MTFNHQAFIVGAYEHPTRLATEQSVLRLHADVAIGALADAGLHKSDIDAYFCAGDMPGVGAATFLEYLDLKVRYMDTTESGGSAPIMHVGHAAHAIASGRCNVALITLAGRPRAAAAPLMLRAPDPDCPDVHFERPFAPAPHSQYAMAAQRHMHEFGTTSEQLAWIKVAASHHAQHNPHAMLRKTVTVDDVLASPLVASPLHKLDCCVVSDGGGAVIVARPEIARSLKRPLVGIRAQAEAVKNSMAGHVDLTYTAARQSGADAFSQAGILPRDIQYASLYDSFTITVLLQLEDLGFCKKGEGGSFVADGNLISGRGQLPFNTDGGGLCSNHPANRGGMTKIIEAVRQLRGEAHPALQVPGCTLALANGIGGAIATRHTSATLIMERI
jgi:acetyl-CoA C-acetyltransferase